MERTKISVLRGQSEIDEKRKCLCSIPKFASFFFLSLCLREVVFFLGHLLCFSPHLPCDEQVVDWLSPLLLSVPHWFVRERFPLQA